MKTITISRCEVSKMAWQFNPFRRAATRRAISWFYKTQNTQFAFRYY